MTHLYPMPHAMSPTEPSPDSTLEFIRPSSGWTNDSAFADSAISMGSNTPKQLDDDPLELRSPTSPKYELSEHLTELAAVAWAAEQDSYIDHGTKQDALTAIKIIESCLSDGDRQDEANELLRRREVSAQQAEREQAQLHYVHEQLAATVASMRSRQQEQRHISEVALRKLEDVANTCATQEETIDSLEREVDRLRIENRKLSRDSDGFQAHAVQLTHELEQKDLAVQAMSSTVAGLDGWIQTALGPGRPTRRVRVARGRGRFRTHYYVDVPIEGELDQECDRTVDAREVRDGITAWVRGFRDVEDAMHASTQPIPIGTGYNHGDCPPETDTQGNEEWGDFQTVSSTRLD